MIVLSRAARRVALGAMVPAALFTVLCAGLAAPAAAHFTTAPGVAEGAANAVAESERGDEPLRVGSAVRPSFQAIDLWLDADQPDYRGSTRVDLEVVEATDRIHFHAEGMILTAVTLRGPDGETIPHELSPGREITTLHTATLVPGRGYELTIEFENPYDTQAIGLYRTEVDGQGYLFTQFQADDAREAFPCWDEPEFKIPFQLTLRVPEDHEAVTNTPVLRETAEDGWRVMLFQRTKPLPSYLLAIATGPLEFVEVEGLGFPSRIVTVQGQSHLTEAAIEVTGPILRFLEDYFGLQYPYAKLDQIAVPEFWPGGMENAGAITYADNILLLDPATATVGDRRSLTRVVAHELAHMWFGDLVTMRWWDDLWLNESFATWMETRVSEALYPELGVAAASADSAQEIMGLDARVTTEAIRRPIPSGKQLMEGLGVTYQKGRAVLAMFETWLGREDFRRGVVSYLREHAWQNATSDDLWRALNEASGKNVSAAMTTFLEQPGVPRVDIEVLDDGKLRLRQSRFLNYGAEAPAQTWRVPVGLRYATADGVRDLSVLLETEEMVVDLGTGKAPAWVFPNRNGDGYYRWTLPVSSMQALAEHSAEVLSSRERIAFVGNLVALMFAGDLDGGSYLAMLGRILDDPDPLVVRAALDQLGIVRMAFVPAELEDDWAAYVRRTLRPAADRFGLEPTAGESESVALLRPSLLRWLGREGHDPKVLERADDWVAAYLEDPASVPPSIAGVAVDLAALDGDVELFDTYRARFESARSPAERAVFLEALGSFVGEDMRRRTLGFVLEGQLRPNEMFRPIFGMFGDAAGRELVFSWLLENYDAVMARLPPVVAPMMPRVASGCSAARLERAHEFFTNPERDAPGVATALAKVTESVNECVALREREGASVTSFLTGTS
ncbi:MAG: M1 family aminopeptidase [Acidobacteriota bacterium]